MSSNAVEAKDYLTSLPNELLQAITELVVRQRDVSSLAFVHPVFLAFIRSKRFSKLTIKGPYRLSRLINVLKASGHAGASVKTLELDFFNSQQDETVLPSRQDFVSFLGTLSVLKELTIKRSTKLIRTFLSRSPPLPCLIRVVLEDTFKGWQNPFDAVHYTTSAEIPSFAISPSPSTVPSPPVEDLLYAFGTIRCLFLHETESSPSHITDFPRVLYGIWRPETVDFFSLESRNARPGSFTRLSNALRSLEGLTSLRFSKNAWVSSLTPALRQLPYLSTLYFQAECGSPMRATSRPCSKDPSGSSLCETSTKEEPNWLLRFGRKDMVRVMEKGQRVGVWVQGWIAEWIEEDENKRVKRLKERA
ncbi:hypothetical protein JCM8547_006241 [Rhodosporidiobolus lusitaniae]